MTILDSPFDPACDPQHPKIIKMDDIRDAMKRIEGKVVRTPCIKSEALSDVFHCEIYLKLDCMQRTGSFKERGARNAITKVNSPGGVICASAGNHGQGVAYHGKLLGIPVTVVMPTKAPALKVQACRKFKANVILHGEHVGESKTHALKLAHEKGLVYINGFDNPDVLAGQGTVAIELVEQVPEVDMVVVPVGGGGLIAGVSVAMKSLRPNSTIVGVEPENCASFANSLKAGKAIPTESKATIADGLYVPLPGYNSVATCLGKVDEMVAVPEEFFILAIFRLVESEKIIVEGAGSAGVAALLSGSLQNIEGKKVVLLLSGRNIDTHVLCDSLARGLNMSNRIIRFTMSIKDKDKDIPHIQESVKAMGLNVRHIKYKVMRTHDQEKIKQLSLLIETATECLAKEIADRLRQNYPDVEREEF